MEQNARDLPHDSAVTKLHPVTTLRASEAIYRQIQDLILSGELKTGDHLPSERSLMERLRRSRPTIREALRMLEHAGLIATTPGANGAIVCKPSTGEAEKSLMLLLQTSQVTVAELAEYRLANETAIARWAACRRSGEDLLRLGALLDASEALLREEDFAGFIENDALFHRELAGIGRNTVAAMMAELMSRMSAPKELEAVARQSRARNRAMCRRILDMHRGILEAVRAGDPAAAAEAMAGHLDAFGSDLGEGDAQPSFGGASAPAGAGE